MFLLPDATATPKHQGQESGTATAAAATTTTDGANDNGNGSGNGNGGFILVLWSEVAQVEVALGVLLVATHSPAEMAIDKRRQQVT